MLFLFFIKTIHPSIPIATTEKTTENIIISFGIF